MSHLVDSQLKRFQLDSETHELAKSLLHTAQLRTAPGSGRELGHGAAGLPAICAYIACNQLNSTEVDLNTAQAASCIRSLVFKKTLEIVESVLETSSSTRTTQNTPSSSQSSSKVAYAKLLHNHKFRKNTNVLLSWLTEAEKALLISGELRSAELKELKDGQLLRCAIFGWTCAISKSQNVTHKILKEHYNLQSDAYDDLVRVLDSACLHIADQIRQQRAQMRQKDRTKAPSALSTPASSPTKSSNATPRPSSPTKSPTKSALKRNSSIFTSVEQPTPTKRKVAFTLIEEVEDTEIAIETPSKKAKLTLPTRPTSASASSSKSELASTSRASSSRLTLDHVQEADEPMQPDLSPSRTPKKLALPLPSPLDNSKIPSTPRRTRQSMSPIKSISTSKFQSPNSSFARDEASQPSRFRPIFLDHKQWLSRDPRIEREIKKGEDIKRRLMELHGESMIERYRPMMVE